MTLKTVLVVVVLLLIGYMLITRRGDVSAAEARRLITGGAKLVDVRSPGEFASGHIDGAVNIPVQEIERRMSELGPKDTTVILYCQSGARSALAARRLKDAGYASVHNLGAMGRW
ncbi:MAG: rhodanese-like domain-containing protein [Polyangiaceae bacterium]|nr:rhodanese-like domain-containing protein [Polyangiaceae bacterium]